MHEQRPVTLPRVDERKSRTREVLEVLRASIIRGDLRPGSMHSVGSLAEMLGVSRTPVREALIELASRGMVRFERNRGVLIVESSIHDLEEIFEMRRLLEPQAARNAVRLMTPGTLDQLHAILERQATAAANDDQERLWNLDREFHHTLLAASGNRRLADYVDHLRDMVIVRDPARLQSTSNERGVAVGHAHIIESVERRDEDATAAAVLAHLEQTFRMLVEQEREFQERAYSDPAGDDGSQAAFSADAARRL
jgi:DNA-binding GntR family transcriptional regulator